MAERPDYEKAIALLSAPGRQVRSETQVVAPPLGVGGTASLYFEPTSGYVARLVGLRVRCPKASVAPASGALILTVNVGSINRCICCFGFAQWGTTTANEIGFWWSRPMAGPYVQPLTNTFSTPSIYCYPAAEDWWGVLAGLPMTAGNRLTVALYNGTNVAGNAADYFNVQALLDEEAVS